MDHSFEADRPLVPKAFPLRKGLKTFFNYSVIVLAILNLGIAIWAYASMSSYGNVIKDFKENWQMNPIGKIFLKIIFL
jgi:hypothetical protein